MLLLVRLASLLIIAATWFDTMVDETRLGLVSRRNKVRRQAAVAYQAGRFQEALVHYRYIVQTSQSPSLGEQINLGHVYFKLGQYASAKRHYASEGAEATPQLRSVAATQLGLLACLNKDTTLALVHFRSALLNNPDNVAARQNYELLKLRFSGKQARPNTVQTTPQPTPQPESSQGQQVDKTEQQRDKLDRFRNTTLSDAQAREVLDALQADDLPYELARRRAAKQKTDPTNGRW
ncbi:hypothetical protein [Fibrella aquatica]|jgi:tetratricopeptide (TPR) repeat protein|uniref:hypothetical protein n=1 Tax=Fibrella aquatica TaxID=3242487 RepID=UPI00351FB441